MKNHYPLLGILPAFALCGCGHKEAGIVGDWTGTYTAPSSPAYPATFHFDPTGTGRMTAGSPFGKASGGLTYSLDSGVLTITATSATLAGKVIPFTPAPPEHYAATLKENTLTLVRQGQIASGEVIRLHRG